MTTITPPPSGAVGIGNAPKHKGGGGSSSTLPFYRQPLFLFKITVYVGTGVLQPLIVDTLRMSSCLGRKSLLLPTLAKTSGMALVGLLSTRADRSTLRHLLRTSADFRRSLLLAALVDLISGMLLTGGILLTGGAIFVVLYNSCPAWTAILSKYFLGRSLTSKQSIGVMVVVLGLICNVFGTTEQLSGKGKQDQHLPTVILGSGIVLMGCILHSAFFVISDRSLRGRHGKSGDCHGPSKGGGSDNAAVISPPLWSSCLGSMEATVMATYILSSISVKGFQEEGMKADICPATDFVKGFTFMLLVDALHSAAFFLMLKQIGAVGSALLKGIQSVAVVILSAIFFCPHEEAQCITTVKSISVVLVLAGTFLYAAGSTAEDESPKGGQISLKSIEKQRGGDGLPSVEVESLLDT